MISTKIVITNFGEKLRKLSLMFLIIFSNYENLSVPCNFLQLEIIYAFQNEVIYRDFSYFKYDIYDQTKKFTLTSCVSVVKYYDFA